MFSLLLTVVTQESKISNKAVGRKLLGGIARQFWRFVTPVTQRMTLVLASVTLVKFGT